MPCFIYLSRRRDKRACRELELEWRHETFGRRNAVERLFFTTKHRLKSFYIPLLYSGGLILTSSLGLIK